MQQHDRSPKTQNQNQRSRILVFDQKPKTNNTVTESNCSFGPTHKPKIRAIPFI